MSDGNSLSIYHLLGTLRLKTSDTCIIFFREMDPFSGHILGY